MEEAQDRKFNSAGMLSNSGRSFKSYPTRTSSDRSPSPNRRNSAGPRIKSTTSQAAIVKARSSPAVIGLTPLEMLSTDHKKNWRRKSSGFLLQMKNAPFMLHPHSHIRLRWDLVSVVLIFCGAILIPVSTYIE